MDKITVYTVILDDYDNLRPPEVTEPGVRYVCITDQPLRCRPWEIEPAWMRYDSYARNSRIPKILSHVFFDTEYTIYHDGCFSLLKRPSEIIANTINRSDIGKPLPDIALVKHPCRKSVYEELACCKRENIGYGDAMEEQVRRYQEKGLKQGLWCGGFIVRRNNEKVQRFNDAWWNEYIHGCMRDQIAMPMALYDTNMDILTINANIHNMPYAQFHLHSAFKGGDTPEFKAIREANAYREKRLKRLCPTL